MENGLVVRREHEVSVNYVQDLIQEVKDSMPDAKASNTRRAYQSDWKHFAQWCDKYDYQAIPALDEVVSAYLMALLKEGYKTSTIQRRISSISQAHQAAGYESPTQSYYFRTAWAALRRTYGTAQVGKAPAVVEDIRMMVDTLPDKLLGIRDRALLLVGFAAAFRRSELVSLDVENVEFTRDGLVILLRKSKTDQEGQGRKIGIPYGSKLETCPVRALQAWLDASGITSGPLFRSVNRHGRLQLDRLSGYAVALVVKRCAEAAGLDPARYAGHSLRSGLATSAAAAGVSERAIMNQTGHKSLNMVRRYIREGSLFRENAAASVGL